jgi:hypothetical protein
MRGIRRRRTCDVCLERYTTYEMALDMMAYEDQQCRATGIATTLRQMATALERWGQEGAPARRGRPFGRSAVTGETES